MGEVYRARDTRLDRKLLETRGIVDLPFSVSPDGRYGKKFVMNTVLPQSVTEPLTLITNWAADLKQ